MIDSHHAPQQPGDADAQSLRDLLVAGRPLDAFASASRFPPFEAWTHPRARRVAKWLCGMVGGPRRGRALDLGTYRLSPRSAVGRLTRLQLILELRGPLEAWRALSAEGGAEGALDQDATDEDLAELPLFEGHVLARFRDFDRATAAIQRAGERGASPRRVALFHAHVLMERDRYREALEAALRARDVAPDSSDVIGFTALLHVLLGDSDEALAVLRSGAKRTQSADLAHQLASMLEDRKLFDERHEWIERWAERVPLLERTEQLALLRADGACERGELRTALEILRREPSKVAARLAERMAQTIDDASAKRVLLDVPFVRQHHMTCAPATLTALAGYWRMPADHLEVAEAICYDGTPSHSLRTWAEEHGFVAREMTVTWDVARALLNRGLPFTVAIVEGASAHLQAVVGYDERRGTLLLRDPFIPNRLEALAEEWLETWHATGPHGMVFVPVGQEARLEGIDLPDAPLCDELHRLNAALGRHDRDAAHKACEALVLMAPSHRLAIAARRALAAYDHDAEAVLACARETAALFPGFVAAKLDALSCMRAVRDRDSRSAEAEALVRAHPKEPLYAEALALTLADDARQHPAAVRLLRRAHRARPDRYGPLALVADISWDARMFDEALSIRRFAACLGRFDEAAVMTYFVSASALGRENEAIALLEARAKELGVRAGPVGTLFRALEAMGRVNKGLAVVEEALERRRDDGELLLLAAEIRGAEIGDVEEARRLLARADGVAKRTEWLRAGAQLALRGSAFAERKELLERILECEPLDVAAHVSYASAIAASEGPAAARAYLERAWGRMPHLRSLAHVYLEWLRGAGAASSERAARRVLEVDPADDWVHRELAIALAELGRTGEAWKALEVAAAVAPTNSSLECVRGALFRREGKRDEARAAFSAALELDPDRSGAIVDLLSGTSGSEEREHTLDAVGSIVHARSVTGAGILAWYGAARATREPRRLAETLARLRAERPNLAVTSSISIAHLSLMGDHDAALALADEACARFPLVCAVWTARADALLAARRSGEALVAIERAARVDSLSITAVSRLARMCLRCGDAARAKEVLARAIGRVPASAALRVQLAELAWGLGDREEALAQVETALALEGEHDDAWKLLDDWSASAKGDTGDGGGKGRGGVLTRIESLSAERSWSAHAALTLARAKARRDDAEGALAVLDRATELDPRFVEAHDYRSAVLALLGRFDRAEAACAPAAFAGDLPRELRGRAAWVRARRGDLAGACRAMRELLVEQVDYAWGWSELARWERQRGAPDAFLAAAKQLVVTSPSAPGCHRLLAGALLEVGDRPGAKKALERAVDLAPNDEGVLLALFDALLDEDDLVAAEGLVPLLRAARSAVGHGGEARLFARRGEGDRALEALRALAVDPRADAELIDGAYQACVLAGRADRCDRLVVDLLQNDAAHAHVGAVWVRRRLSENDSAGVANGVKELDPKRAAVRGAASTWLDLLRRRGERDAGREAARLVRKRFSPCADDGLWSEVAASLLAGACAECVSWTQDWRARPALSSWMLLNAASALREVGQYEAAYDVVQHAARLPTDGASRSHRVWLAFELAMRGEHVEARRWLTDAGNLAAVPVLETVAALTNASLVAQEAGAGLSAFGRARALLSSARAQEGPSVVQFAYGRAVRRVAADAGFLGTLWTHRVSLAISGAIVAVLGLAFVSANVTWPSLSGGDSRSLASSESSAPGFPSFQPSMVVLVIFVIRMALRGRGRRRGA